ncbi:MAG: hypothetical protein MZW92_37970 [Comamonadaceae bacterium]|nr:hypothetical protein [Comamonadaceae bacterium]
MILISGRGSNLRALLDAGLPCARRGGDQRPTAAPAGLDIAPRRHGDRPVVWTIAAYASRDGIRCGAGRRDRPPRARPGACWPGFMRVLSDDFVRALRRPPARTSIRSLLPAFPRPAHPPPRAARPGVRIHGCTVHFVTGGPRLRPDRDPGRGAGAATATTEDALAARVLAQEHRIYPQAARWFAGRSA